MSEYKDVRPVLRSGMGALWDTMSGMIPVKVLSITGESGAPSSNQRVVFKIARDKGPWRKGEQHDAWGLRVVPRAAFLQRRHGARITYYTVEADRQSNPSRGYRDRGIEVRTKYVSNRAGRGGIRATWGESSLTMPYDHALSRYGNHRAAAVRLIERIRSKHPFMGQVSEEPTRESRGGTYWHVVDLRDSR